MQEWECRCGNWLVRDGVAKRSAPLCCGPMAKVDDAGVARGVPTPPPGVLREVDATLESAEDAFVRLVAEDYRAHPDDAAP